MISIHGRNFYDVVSSVIFRARKETTLSAKSQISMMQFFNALIHMLTVARLNGGKDVDTTDYMYTVRIFIIVTLVTTLAAATNLGVGLYLFKLVTGALDAANAPLFYMIIPVFVLGSMLAQSMDFLAKCFGIYVREELVSIFRTYIEKRFTDNPFGVDLNNNQRAFFESIEVACAHIPAMIKLTVIITGYGLYAITAFHPTLLLTSAMVGILVQFVNRGASSRLDDANTLEKFIEQEVQRDRMWMYENSQNHLGINALQVHFKRMQKNIEDLYRVKTTLAINKSLQEFLSKLVQLLSNAFYYVYFSSAVFLGYMTLGELFIILPFIEEIGKSAAKLIALPMMIAPTRTSADNLIEVWNEVEKRYPIRDSMVLVQMSTEEILYKMCIIVGILLSLQFFSILPALNMTNILIPVLCLNAIVYPKSLMAQLWIYLLKMMEPPKRSMKKGVIPQDPVISYGHTVLNINHKQYAFDEKIFSYPKIQVQGPIAVGKSLTFGLFCGSKLEYHGMNVPGYFPSHRSIVLTPEIKLFTESTYLDALAATFEIDKASLRTYLRTSVKTIGSRLDQNFESDHLSTGMQQLLYVLTGLYKALHPKGEPYQYLCIDEALGGVSKEYLKATYQFIGNQCNDRLNLVVVHHGIEIDGFQKVSPTITENITQFTV